ncbi:MAG: sulfate/thiosulfate ABC transporter permease CysW, partial [Planctomycetota bacterium]|nr:sulfate/thiosulfate ABC transporter permease CysW [Planctomycetota bacterium]
RVEKLFQQFNNPGSFAVASSLAVMALATLLGKVALEKYSAAESIEKEETL